MSRRPAIRCSATSKQSGEPCKNFAMIGGRVCAFHGGKAPQVRRAARRRRDLARATGDLARWSAQDETRRRALAPWQPDLARAAMERHFDPVSSARLLRTAARAMNTEARRLRHLAAAITAPHPKEHILTPDSISALRHLAEQSVPIDWEIADAADLDWEQDTDAFQAVQQALIDSGLVYLSVSFCELTPDVADERWREFATRLGCPMPAAAPTLTASASDLPVQPSGPVGAAEIEVLPF